jgi:hypothetical protein
VRGPRFGEVMSPISRKGGARLDYDIASTEVQYALERSIQNDEVVPS